MKTRLLFDDIYDALAATEGLGGWFFARADGQIFWFDRGHTLSEVMLTPGDGRVGCRSYVEEQLITQPQETN